MVVLKVLVKALWEITKACLYIIGAIFDALVSGGEAARYGHGTATEPPTLDPHSRSYIGPKSGS